MNCLHKITFYFVNRCLLLLFLVCEAWSEMVIKESKIDPFSLLLDNQRQMLDKMDFIMNKLKKLDVMETQMSSLTFAVASTTNKLEQANQNIDNLHENIRNASKDIINTLTHAQLPHVSNHDLKETLAKRNPCYDLIPIFRNGMQDVLKCNSILTLYVNTGEHAGSYESQNPSSKKLIRNVEKYDAKYEHTNNENLPQNVFRKTNSDRLNVEGIILSEIEMIIGLKTNQTNDKLIRVLSLLHNIEYRQHVSAITQDRKLNALGHKISIHQNMLEERITDSLNERFKDMEQRLEGKLVALKDHFTAEETLFSTAITMVTNLSMSLRNLTNLQIEMNNYNEKYLVNSLDNSYNESQYSTEVFDYEPDNDATTPSTVKDDSSVQLGTLNPEIALSNDSSPIDETIADTNFNLSQLLALHVSTFAPTLNNGATDETTTTAPGMTSYLNEVITHIDMEDEKSLEIHGNETKSDTILRQISKHFDHLIVNLEDLLKQRLSKTDEKLTGLRIHQTSSMYTHSKEMRYELAKLERGLSDTIGAIGAKMSKKVDGTRQALLAFIDAAVTSVSSAAVTSSQATGRLVTKALRDSMVDLEEKVAQRDDVKRDFLSCPEIYQRVGGTCYLVLNNVGTSWKDGCRLCKSLGGGLAYISHLSDLLSLKEVLRLKPFQELWITNSMSDVEELNCDFRNGKEEEEELTNSVAAVNGEDILTQFSNTSDLICVTLNVDNFELRSKPCNELLGVICQYRIPNNSHDKILAENTSETSIQEDVTERVLYKKREYF